jgi:hypothetical protein
MHYADIPTVGIVSPAFLLELVISLRQLCENMHFTTFPILLNRVRSKTLFSAIRVLPTLYKSRFPEEKAKEAARIILTWYTIMLVGVSCTRDLVYYTLTLICKRELLLTRVSLYTCPII